MLERIEYLLRKKFNKPIAYVRAVQSRPPYHETEWYPHYSRRETVEIPIPESWAGVPFRLLVWSRKTGDAWWEDDRTS